MISLIRRITRRLVPTGEVYTRSAKSGIWVFATKFSSRFLQILLLIILARLLTPRDFGLMGIALLTLGATQQFSKIGLDTALVQNRRDNIDHYLNTTWVLESTRGLLIFCTLFVTAPFIADFFGEPEATPLIRVIGIAPLLLGFRNPGVVYFKKDLDFHKEFVFRSIGGVTQFAVGVTYALLSPTVWALVIAFVAGDVAKSLVSYLLHGYRPWPAFDIAAAKELINYGKWITGSSIIYYIYSQGDDAFVGWYISATALGFYQYAYRIADIPSSEVSEVISSVSFPAFSKLQDDPKRLKEAILGATRITTFVSIPMSFGIVLIAPSFVPLVLGEDWTPMITVLQLLAIYGLLHSMTRNFGEVWKAIGRPDLITKLGFVRVICIALLIWPATAMWGIEGTAAVVVGVYIFPMLPLDVYFISRTTTVHSREIYFEYLYPIIASGVMFGLLWMLIYMFDMSYIVELLVLIPSGAIIYTVAAYVVDTRTEWGIQRSIRVIINELMA